MKNFLIIIYCLISLPLNTPTLFHLAGTGVLMTFVTDRWIEADYWTGNSYYMARTFNSNKGDWFYWSNRLGISLEDDDFCISAGYLASNTDFYAYIRHSQIENVKLSDHLPKKHFNWGIFVNLGYKF